MVFRNLLITVSFLILFGWGMSSFYSASMDIAAYFQDPERTLMFELNILPIIILGFLGGIVYFINLNKKKNKPWAKSLLLPDEFEESDEREKQITAQACRAAYISMWYSFPFITALLLFYPFIYETVPYYPIFVFLLFPITQSITYLISWKRNY